MSRIQEALLRFLKGEFVIVTDHENRENEGDLVIAAQDITPLKLNFMISFGKGLVCVPMHKKRLEELNLPLMTKKNEEAKKCLFTISVDSKEGITTGISAADRSLTIQKLCDERLRASDFIRPGHIFPLQAAPKLLDEREGHTEASLVLCELTKKKSVAAICEILNDDGSMCRGESLEKFSKKHNIPLISIDEIKEYMRNK